MSKVVNPLTFKDKVKKLIQDPLSLVRYIRRNIRNMEIRKKSSSHVEFYAKVVDERAKIDPNSAIGSETEEHWYNIGQLQFDYILKHGLKKKS